ncbi:TadE/TadG family type IV pilus assembly protein [Neomegalonema sp.]|uniref:TadE/TadG family type IV pilus assembly protein n=1 Tax=Neomegalonema sp. TaxID=2039713 RepID=UPI0026206F4A|nr:TadE/TadG family type IV pilus assembly protein [Neomegalonema sp.]MDD2868919.1 pilus assembly protein [Neomegalonema sp.]
MPRLPHSTIRSFLLRRRGATAVEFAFIIGPLLALILGVVEVSVAHMNNSRLQTSTQKIVRFVETGEGRCAPQEEVRDLFCSYLGIHDSPSCTGKVRILVMPLPDLLARQNVSFDQASNAYEPGVGGDRMGVRAIQKHRVFFPYLGALLGADSGGSGGGGGSSGSQHMYMQATQIFKNEPFNSETPCAS